MVFTRVLAFIHDSRYDRSTPPVWIRNNAINITQGPCVRILNVTDNIPPNITLLGNAVYVSLFMSVLKLNAVKRWDG